MLSLAQRLQDPSLLLWAYRGLAEVSFHLGEFLAAKTYSENSVALYDPQQRRAQTFVYGEDPAMTVLLFYINSLFVLGYPDQALRKSHEALTLARELAHANSMGIASFTSAYVHCCRREHEAAREHAEAVIDLATERGLPFWLALGTIARGWALVEQGEGEAGIAQIRQGLAAYRASGAEEIQTYSLARLAEAYGKGGQVEEGLATVAEALDFVDRTEERFYEAELYRLKGQLTLQQFNVQGSKFKVADPRPLTPNPQAEACFQKAIQIAQRQQAKSLELRAVMSLAKLWQRQGKQKEAHAMLAEIYSWFTEGFDTKDLQEAKGLLADLEVEH
jgi:predicted ATPase